jgi:hypothetical protein
MTTDANEVAVKRVFYHGGRAGLSVGEYILPAAETGYTKLNRRRRMYSASTTRTSMT